MIHSWHQNATNRLPPYIVAIMTPVLAVIAALLFAPVIRTTLLFFIISVLFTAWYGGFKPGLLCGVLSGLLLNYFLLEPRFELIPGPTDLPVLLLFALVCLVISVLEESRLRTERALRQSRDQLQIVLQSISNGVIAQDNTGQVLFANDAAARMAGFKTPDEMLAASIQTIRSHYEIFDQEGHPLPYDQLPTNKALTEGIRGQMNYQWQLVTERKRRWMNFKSAPVFDQRNRPIMSINILTDITEDKESEVQLQNAHQRLQTMLASINNGVVATDIDGRIELINPMAETMTGWTAEQAVGKPFEEVISLSNDPSAAELTSPIRLVLQDKQPINVSAPAQLITQDKRAIPIGYNAAPIRDQSGEVVGAVIVFRDISERQKAEREISQMALLLAAQQKRLKNILANIPGIVWESAVVDGSEHQRLEFVNDYAEKVLGYTREEWLSTPQFGQSIIHPDDLESSQQQAAAIYAAGNLSAVTQFRCIAKDGRIVPIEAHYSILTDENNKVIGTCGLMMDITRRQADEDALKQSALNLQRSNEQLEQFAYVASHDLQEPLRMVTSYMQLLERRYKDQLDQDAKEFIDFAVDGATRMKALINDLLVYSRLKAGAEDFVRFETATALKQAITNLQLSIDETNARIIYDSLPVISGNEGQFVQLFQNLLSNAIKFHGDAPPLIEVKAEQRSGTWNFAVKDNGIGIEPQYVDRIFVIFQRLHTKDRYPGTGIGLAICKKVVDHHGGRIWAESSPGNGTTFRFTIPIPSWSKSS